MSSTCIVKYIPKKLRRPIIKIANLTFNDDKVFSLGFIKSNWKTVIFGTFILQVYRALSKDLQELYRLKFSEPLEYVFNILESSLYLNWTVEVIIVVFAIIYGHYIWRNRHTSLSLMFACGLLLEVICYKSDWHFAQCPFLFEDYQDFFTLVFHIPFIIYLVKFLKYVIGETRAKKYSRIKPFSNDVITESVEGSAKRNYAEAIVSQLLVVDIKKESYTVGIIGSWGSGKSTFLKDLKRAIGERSYVVDFNPWNSTSANQVIKDFFEEMASIIGEIYHPLERELIKYSKELTRLSLHPLLDSALEALPIQDVESVTQLKSGIEKSLSHLDKPVCVYIDDLDRLEKDELFEVLRLVRNTAKFPNLIYVLTLDKTYVVEQLRHKGIDDGSLYLEKIIQLEVSLPKPERIDLFLTFQKECRSMIMSVANANSFLDTLSESDKDVLIGLLPTYRKIKRFARIFSLNVNYLLNQNILDVSDYRDSFYLELIHSAYPDFFEGMYRDPMKFLTIVKHPETNALYYVRKRSAESSKKGTNIEELPIYERDKVLSYLTIQMFGERKEAKNIHSIQYIDNYDSFFCMGLPGAKVSEEEFTKMLSKPIQYNATNGMRNTIQKWCLSRQYKNEVSIFNRFALYEVKDVAMVKCLLYAAFYWVELEERNSGICNSILNYILDKDKYKAIDSQDEIASIAKERLTYLADCKNNILYAKRLANLLEYNLSGHKLIVEEVEIKNALWNNFISMTKDKDWDAINLVTADGNHLNKIVTESAIQTRKGNRIDTHYQNVLIGNVIEWLSDPSRKSSHIDEARSRFEGIEEKLKTRSVYGANGEDAKQLEDFEKIFGVDGFSNYQNYLQKCFK